MPTEKNPQQVVIYCYVKKSHRHSHDKITLYLQLPIYCTTSNCSNCTKSYFTIEIGQTTAGVFNLGCCFFALGGAYLTYYRTGVSDHAHCSTAASKPLRILRAFSLPAEKQLLALTLFKWSKQTPVRWMTKAHSISPTTICANAISWVWRDDDDSGLGL